MKRIYLLASLAFVSLCLLVQLTFVILSFTSQEATITKFQQLIGSIVN